MTLIIQPSYLYGIFSDVRWFQDGDVPAHDASSKKEGEKVTKRSVSDSFFSF